MLWDIWAHRDAQPFQSLLRRRLRRAVFAVLHAQDAGKAGSARNSAASPAHTATAAGGAVWLPFGLAMLVVGYAM
jgi:hypothetical protein